MIAGMADARTRGVVWLAILLACSVYAFALDPSLDVSQYGHTSWNNRDGFPKETIHAIAQTPDGYLWLGTEFGLFRFDGVRAVPWQRPVDQHLPADKIQSLLVARDGTLWIGTWKGLASWKGGKLTTYPELADEVVFPLMEDREGVVWAGGFAYNPPGKLCAIQRGVAKCYGEDGSLGGGVLGLYQDRSGNLWAGTRTGLWLWKPGPRKFYPIAGQPAGIQGLAEDDSGELLIALQGRVVRLRDEKLQTAYRYPGPARKSFARARLQDRDGGLWFGTTDHGLVHVHQGKTDAFAQADGLSGDIVTALFEDREGSVWVATLNGLDRFRDYAVVTYSANQGFPNLGESVLAARDGSIWVNSPDGLSTWTQGQVTVYHGRDIRAAHRLSVREVVVEGLPNGEVASVLQDHDGRIWFAGAGGTGYLENNRFVSIRGAPGGIVYAMAEDTARNLWIANLDHGLLELSGGRVVRQIPWMGLGSKDVATSLAADPVQGGIWVGFFRGGVAYWKDGQVGATYTVAGGLGKGAVGDLRVDRDGMLWAATEGGLSRLKNGHAATLSSKNGLPCDVVNWTIEDEDRSLWLYTACGLVRISRSETKAWDNDPTRSIQVTVFDTSDGVRSRAAGLGISPKAGRSPDGKIWFMTFGGVSVIDPHRLPFNKVPPPVHTEQITADGKTYDTSQGLRLPAGVRGLTIDYTALSFVLPEKVLFRYKLEGLDRDWQNAGNRRQASYHNLPPRSYRFRVMASNNSGVWNEAGDSLDFAIDPAYYQTAWFGASVITAFFVLLWAVYRYRLHQLARQFSVQLDARIEERTSIARDLHDTLLQSFQAALIEFQAARNMFSKGHQAAFRTMDSAIGTAQEAIIEGRDAIQGLRSALVPQSHLEDLLKTAGQELAISEVSNGNRPLFQVTVEGSAQALSPVLQDEIYQIAREVLRNAFRHAAADRIEAEIRYDKRLLRLRVRDDGKGIDRKVLEEGKRPGHWGLQGIRERARRIGARLVIWSEAGAGTEVDLQVPSRIAYATSPARRRLWLLRRNTKA
jgi:ligand-binding sensor domain-containing protein/signal transduction histidine kinase